MSATEMTTVEHSAGTTNGSALEDRSCGTAATALALNRARCLPQQFGADGPAQNNLLPCRRLKKALIARCMMIGGPRTTCGRKLEKCHGKNRISDRGCYIGRGSASAACAGKRGKWSNRRWRRRGTYRRSALRRRPGVTARSAAGILCAGTGLCRRACLPGCSRALLGRVRLGIPASPGLQLILGSQRPQLECPRLLFGLVRANR